MDIKNKTVIERMSTAIRKMVWTPGEILSLSLNMRMLGRLGWLQPSPGRRSRSRQLPENMRRLEASVRCGPCHPSLPTLHERPLSSLKRDVFACFRHGPLKATTSSTSRKDQSSTAANAVFRADKGQHRRQLCHTFALLGQEHGRQHPHGKQFPLTTPP